MNFEYTLCKKCYKCIEFEYENTTRDGTKFKFKYCKQNEKLIKKYRYGIRYKDNVYKLNPEIVIRSGIVEGRNHKLRNRKLINVLRKEEGVQLNYLNENPFDLRLKNLTTSISRIYEEENINLMNNGSDETSENSDSKEKTMCKKCDICKTYIYERKTKRKNDVRFKFCEGNREILMKYEFSIAKSSEGEEYVSIASKKSKVRSYAKETNNFATSLFKNNRNNATDYINGDKKDLRLKNMREITYRCLTQKDRGYSNNFPGVKKAYNTYKSGIFLDGKWINLGRYKTEMDAYHAYVLKHAELGIKLNTETDAHKKYLNEYEPSKFKKIKHKTASDFKGVTKCYNRFQAYDSKKRKFIGKFDKEIDAFHAYVLWCKETNKEVDTTDPKYQKFLEKNKPPNNLEEFKRSKQKKQTSRFPNVYLDKKNKKWIGQISKNKKIVYYKCFDNEYDAHVNVEKKKIELKEEKNRNEN